MQESLFPLPQTGTTSDDYWTPKWLFDALGIEFDVDVACPPEGPPHTPAKHWFTQETNGLAQPWHGRVWMNPPFSNTAPFARRFMEHANGICLVPLSRSKWWEMLWNDAHAILPLPASFKFDQGGIFIATMLAAYTPECVEALHRSNLGRVR
jgi:hypothetical protein